MGTQGKTTLHYVEVVETCEANETVLLRVLTRAQAQQQDPLIEKKELKKNPRKRTRRKASNKAASMDHSQVGGHISEAERIPRGSLEENSKTSSGGSVLLEKVNENLETLLKVFRKLSSCSSLVPLLLFQQESKIFLQDGIRVLQD